MSEDGMIEVTVTFALSTKPPFREREAGDTSVGTVLAEVMKHFEAKPEPNVTWYLTAHDERQPDSKTVREVAGREDQVKFRLVKDVTNG